MCAASSETTTTTTTATSRRPEFYKKRNKNNNNNEKAASNKVVNRRSEDNNKECSDCNNNNSSNKYVGDNCTKINSNCESRRKFALFRLRRHCASGKWWNTQKKNKEKQIYSSIIVIRISFSLSTCVARSRNFSHLLFFIIFLLARWFIIILVGKYSELTQNKLIRRQRVASPCHDKWGQVSVQQFCLIPPSTHPCHFAPCNC